MRDLNVEADKLRSEYVRTRTADLDLAAAVLESPLERALFWALCNSAPAACVEGEGPGGMYPGGRGKVTPVFLVDPYPPVYRIEFAPQLEVECSDRTYRFDFALKATDLTDSGQPRRRVHVDVELDGHEFHERTKEQAERDKERDRNVQSAGWAVARFTGSQVYRDPAGVARELIGFATGLLWRP